MGGVKENSRYYISAVFCFVKVILFCYTILLCYNKREYVVAMYFAVAE